MPTLRSVRTDRLLTQIELSKASGVSLATINAIETGESLPHLRTIRKLCAALKIDNPRAVDEFAASLKRSAGD